MCFVDSEFSGKGIKKTPPIGETGGEKQYKDYEKNPMLLYSLCLRIENGAKISIIFIRGTFFSVFFIKRVQAAIHAPAITAWRP